jgi:DNA processing protein
VREAVSIDAVQRRAELVRLGVRTLYREELPDHLAGLPDAPDLLFVKGDLPPSPGVAIVGTRRATSYGRNLARVLGRAVAASGWTVISGLARGVDGLAHEGTLEGGGIGIAVLGSGVDVWYPREHRRLGERLLELGGAVLSEFPPGTVPEPWRFPCRNRLISGLAAAVVVVEAGRTGGALITARTALDQGREVLAVPGDVDRETSMGCNLLIRDGAHPVLGSEDLIEALSSLLGPPASAPRPDEAGGLVGLIPAAGIPTDDLLVADGRPSPVVLGELGLLVAQGAVLVEAGWVRRV